MANEDVKGGFTLPNKKVIIKPNDNNPGWIKNSRHAAYFKVEGSYESYPVAMLNNGQLKNPFTKEEKVFLEKELQFPENELSIYNKEGMLRNIQVRLTKDPLILDLSDPMDYIRYKVLLTNSDRIAPSIKDKTKKGTYKFYVESQEDLTEIKKTSASLNQIAWKEYGKMEENRDKLIAFLKIYGQVLGKAHIRIDKETKLDFLQAKVTEIIESKMKEFVEIIQSPDYEIILLIAEAIETGVMRKDGTKYSLAEGDLIGNTLKDTINYLKAPINQELTIVIEEKIKLKT